MRWSLIKVVAGGVAVVRNGFRGAAMIECVEGNGSPTRLAGSGVTCGSCGGVILLEEAKRCRTRGH